MKFVWERGRSLKKITVSNNSSVDYKYNQNGLRTYKKTADDTVTEYEWDESVLLRERVKNSSTDMDYDIWYLYDSSDNVLGYEYSYLDSNNNKQKETVYYEKNFQGDIIGLIDENGSEFATYSYDAWGNITDTGCESGYETAYSLNHIKYRGYYRDEESGFYYLQSRYYDSVTCRFINADDIGYFGASGTVWGYNLYSYCENSPIVYIDPQGTVALITCVIIGVIAGAVAGAALSKMIYGKVNGWWVLGGAIIGGTLGYVGGAFFGASGIKAGTLASKISMSKVRWLGRIGEKISKWPKNTKHIDSLSKTAKYRIPDYLNTTERIIGDVKNVKYLSYTNQLKDFMMYAEQKNYTYILMIRQNTKLSSTIKALVDEGKIIIMYLKR